MKDWVWQRYDAVGLGGPGGRGSSAVPQGSLLPTLPPVHFIIVDRFFLRPVPGFSSNALIYIFLMSTFLPMLFYRLH